MSDIRPKCHALKSCSAEKHAAIRAGLDPWRKKGEPPDDATAFRYALTYTRTTARGVECSCCEFVYAEWQP